MEALLVSPAEAGQKLLSFLERRLLAQPAELHRWVRSGQVRLNGGRVHPFDRVAVNDRVRIPPFAVQRNTGQAEPGPSGAAEFSALAAHAEAAALAGPKIAPFPLAVHEDAELLVINKPSGLPSQGGSGHSDSVASRLQSHFAALPFVPSPAHRLDKDTSGLLLAAKSYATLRALHTALAGKEENQENLEKEGSAARQVGQDGQDGPKSPATPSNCGILSKDYLCWVQGYWPEAGCMHVQESLVDFVRKSRQGEQERMEVCPERAPEAKRALCQATCLAQRRLPGFGPVSLVLVRLLTGRTHQIRIQFSSRGFPLLGDGKYGYRGPAVGLKLHAFRLTWQGKTYSALPEWAAPLAVSGADI